MLYTDTHAPPTTIHLAALGYAILCPPGWHSFIYGLVGLRDVINYVGPAIAQIQRSWGSSNACGSC